MDTKLLTFIEVCQTKNYTMAAKNLNLTQPAVSQHIKSLENEYNTKLIKRNENEIIITESGLILLKYAKRIQSLYNNLSRKIEDNKKYARSLIVGITHTAESNITPEILADYTAENSGTYIRIISDSISNLYDKLNNFQIDLAIIEGNINRQSFSSILLGTDSLTFIVSPKNHLARKKIVDINDVKKEKLILRNFDSGTTKLFISELEKMNYTIDNFNVNLEIDNVATIKDLVEKDFGVSILPYSSCKKEISENKLVALYIKNMNMTRETNLVYKEDNIDKIILNDLVGMFAEKIKSIR